MARTVTLPWPQIVGQWELWAQAVAVWTIAAYAFDNISGPKDAHGVSKVGRWGSRERALRIAVAATVGGSLIGFSFGHLYERSVIAGSLAVAILVLGAGRPRLAATKRAAEWEIVVNASVLIGIAFIVASLDLVVIDPVFVLPMTEGRVAAVFAVCSAVIFVVGGGTRIVRGILDKVEALPPVKTAGGTAPVGDAAVPAVVDVPEYNRGKTIGNIERLLMLVVVGVGSYEALGFMIAAKGLIRAKEFEDRNYVEYFIVGNLASVLVALLVAIPLKAIVEALWYR